VQHDVAGAADVDERVVADRRDRDATEGDTAGAVEDDPPDPGATTVIVVTTPVLCR